MGKDKKEGRGTEQKNTGGHGNDKYPQASQLKKKKNQQYQGTSSSIEQSYNMCYIKDSIKSLWRKTFISKPGSEQRIRSNDPINHTC